MKKPLILITSLSLIIIISLTLYNTLFKVEKPLYTQTNAKKVENLSKEKKDFIVYLYQENCAGCKKMKPVINKYIKENDKKVYALDINNKDNVTYASSTLKIHETPTIIFFKNGKEKDRAIGQISKEEIKKKMK